jgi:dTDP-4-dehydrorhamnose reductase
VAPIKEIKWLILGGNGQLGHAMADFLKKNGSDYTSLNHQQLDILDRQAFQKCLTKIKPSVILNFAAWTDVDLAESKENLAYLVNAVGPRTLAEEVKKTGAKFIHLSTDYVFSGNSTSAWREDAIAAPISAYGRTKAEGENFVLSAYPNGAYVIRTSWLFSPWGKNFVKTISKIALHESRKIEVVNDQIGQPTSATDLAAQIFQLVSQGTPPGTYHFTNSGQASWFELAQKIFVICEQDPDRVIPIDSKDLPRPATRPKFSVLGNHFSEKNGLKPMQTWDTALRAVMPSIIKTLNSE